MKHGSKTTYQIIVKGKVQGVFYRKYTELYARSCVLYGNVKNQENGDVEVFVNASEDELSHFTRLLKIGSPNCEVEDIRVTAVQPQDFEDFKIIR